MLMFELQHSSEGGGHVVHPMSPVFLPAFAVVRAKQKWPVR